VSDNFQVKWEVNFTRMPNWLLDFKDKEGNTLSDKAIRTYFALASFANNDTMEAFPSQALLAERANMSTRSVQRYLKELTDLNIITVFKKSNGKDKWVSNLYQLSVNAPSTMVVQEEVEVEEVNESVDLGVAANGRKRTPNDEIWDGFEEFIGTAPKGDKVNAGKWVTGIKRLVGIYEEAGVGIDQYKLLTMTACAAYSSKYGDDIPLNPQSLANNWENIQPKKYDKSRIKKITAHMKYSQDLPQGTSVDEDGRIVLDG